MKIVQEDLFQHPHDAIAQGVNCQRTMGSGIAREFRRRYPEMYEDYLKTEMRPGDVHTFQVAEGPHIFNIASQEFYGRHGGPYARLEWLATGLAWALNEVDALGLDQLHLPLIGGGLGGLEKDDVIRCMEQVERNRRPYLVLHLI